MRGLMHSDAVFPYGDVKVGKVGKVGNCLVGTEGNSLAGTVGKSGNVGKVGNLFKNYSLRCDVDLSVDMHWPVRKISLLGQTHLELMLTRGGLQTILGFVC